MCIDQVNNKYICVTLYLKAVCMRNKLCSQTIVSVKNVFCFLPVHTPVTLILSLPSFLFTNWRDARFLVLRAVLLCLK